DAAERERMVREAADAARGADAAILADFALGAVVPATVGPLCRALRAAGVLAGDVSGRRANLLGFEGMDLISPSESEVRAATGFADDGLASVVWSLLDVTRSRAAIVTLGADGLIAFDRTHGAAPTGGRWLERLAGEHVPSFAPFAVDQLGCGDALLAAATLALAAGATVPQAAIVGSAAASLEARRLGNIPIDAADLRRALARITGAQLAYGATPAAGLAGAAV
ncbi:MAG: PfkB family carbohydrate kinase, partial [Planctomycetota bacterium]